MSEVVIATCYGASNTGQLAGVVATELAREEGYRLVCLPSVAVDEATGLDKVAEAEQLVVIEGCRVMCCTQILEDHIGRRPDVRVGMERSARAIGMAFRNGVSEWRFGMVPFEGEWLAKVG